MQLAINSSPRTGQDGGKGRGEDGEEGEERKGISPGEGRGGDKKKRRREREREERREAEGRGRMIGRGRELTVWACKMAYSGLSI